MRGKLEQTSPCQSCGRQHPTAFVSLKQTTGAVIARYESCLNAYLCPYCLNFHFWRITRHNLLLGWWSPFSAFLTVIYTVENMMSYIRFRTSVSHLGGR